MKHLSYHKKVKQSTGGKSNDLFILGQPVTDENVTDNPSTSIDRNTADIHFTNTGEMPEAVDAAMTAQNERGGQDT